MNRRQVIGKGVGIQESEILFGIGKEDYFSIQRFYARHPKTFDYAVHIVLRQYFVRKTFHRFFTSDTIQWFEERGVKLKTEADGRMFPVTDSSQTIIDCLLKEAGKYDEALRLYEEGDL